MNGQQERQALRNRELGNHIARMRRQRGWTRDQLAERARLSVGVIKKLEWGGTASINSYHAIADALGMELAFSRADAAPYEPSDGTVRVSADLLSNLTQAPAAPPWLTRPEVAEVEGGQAQGLAREDTHVNRRQFFMLTALAGFGIPEHIQALFAAGRCPDLDEELVNDIATRSEEHLLRQDAAIGGGAVCDVAIAMYEKVRSWLNQGGYTVGVTRALEVLSGDLGAWAGWLATDAGRHQAAYRYLQETIAQARMADCPGSELHALENSCILLNLIGRPQQSLQAAHTALRIAGDRATPRVQAIFHMRAARAHAHLGNQFGFSEHTDAAKRAIDRLDQQREPAWTYFLRPSTLEALTGVSLLELGDAKRAVESLYTITSGRDPDLQRAHVYYTVQLARSLARLGDTDEAGKIAIAVLPKVLEISSEWSRRDLCKLRNVLSRHPAAGANARNFVDAYDEAVRMEVGLVS